jgi:hypothetical protein
MESVTNRYVDFGTIQFCSNDQQLHILSMLPSSEWRGLFTVTVVYFAEKLLFDDKACQCKWNTSSMCHPQVSELQQPNDPCRSKKIYETQS